MQGDKPQTAYTLPAKLPPRSGWYILPILLHLIFYQYLRFVGVVAFTPLPSTVQALMGRSQSRSDLGCTCPALSVVDLSFTFLILFPFPTGGCAPCRCGCYSYTSLLWSYIDCCNSLAYQRKVHLAHISIWVALDNHLRFLFPKVFAIITQESTNVGKYDVLRCIGYSVLVNLDYTPHPSAFYIPSSLFL